MGCKPVAVDTSPPKAGAAERTSTVTMSLPQPALAGVSLRKGTHVCPYPRAAGRADTGSLAQRLLDTPVTATVLGWQGHDISPGGAGRHRRQALLMYQPRLTRGCFRKVRQRGHSIACPVRLSVPFAGRRWGGPTVCLSASPKAVG